MLRTRQGDRCYYMPEVSRESENCLLTSCNCQWGISTGSNMNSFLWFTATLKMSIVSCTYLCHRDILHHNTYVNRFKYTNSVFLLIWFMYSIVFSRSFPPVHIFEAWNNPKTKPKLCYDRQSASLSWCQALIWGPRPDFCCCQTLAGLLTCGAFSDEMMGLSFTIAAGPRQRSHYRVRVPWDSWPYFTLSDSGLPQPGGQFPVFIPPRKRVAQLHLRALGSLFVAFCDSQGYGGGIRNLLHTGTYSALYPRWCHFL
jgi:hypothetical protein